MQLLASFHVDFLFKEILCNFHENLILLLKVIESLKDYGMFSLLTISNLKLKYIRKVHAFKQDIKYKSMVDRNYTQHRYSTTKDTKNVLRSMNVSFHSVGKKACEFSVQSCVILLHLVCLLMKCENDINCR